MRTTVHVTIARQHLCVLQCVQVSVGGSHDKCMLLMQGQRLPVRVSRPACKSQTLYLHPTKGRLSYLYMEGVPPRGAKSPRAVIKTITGQIGPMICMCDQTPGLGLSSSNSCLDPALTSSSRPGKNVHFK